MGGSVPIPFPGDWVLITGTFGLEPSDQFALDEEPFEIYRAGEGDSR